MKCWFWKPNPPTPASGAFLPSSVNTEAERSKADQWQTRWLAHPIIFNKQSDFSQYKAYVLYFLNAHVFTVHNRLPLTIKTLNHCFPWSILPYPWPRSHTYSVFLQDPYCIGNSWATLPTALLHWLSNEAIAHTWNASLQKSHSVNLSPHSHMIFSDQASIPQTSYKYVTCILVKKKLDGLY